MRGNQRHGPYHDAATFGSHPYEMCIRDSPFVGPLCTGIVGGLPLLAVAAIMLWDMRRREKAGTLRMPEAVSYTHLDVYKRQS